MRLIKYVLILILLLGMEQVMASEFDPLEEIYSMNSQLVVAQAVKSPVIDGKISSGEWDNASAVTGFFSFDDEKFLGKSPVIFLTYDEKAIYTLMLVPVESGRPVMANAKGWDSAVFKDDSAEIFFHVGKKELYQIVVNSIGTIADLKNNSFEWNGNIKAKGGTITSDKLPLVWAMPKGKYWYAEMKIPFSDFGTGKPKAGDTWGLNVAVNRSSPWACLAERQNGGDFSETSFYPDLKFIGSGKPYVQLTGIGNVRFGQGQLQGRIINRGPTEISVAVDFDLRKKGSTTTHDAYRNIIGVIHSQTDSLTVKPNSELPFTLPNVGMEQDIDQLAVRVSLGKANEKNREIILALHGPAVVEPPLVLKLGNVPTKKYIVVDANCDALFKRVSRDEIRLRVAVRSSEGKQPICKTFAPGEFKARIDYSKLSPGLYVCEVGAYDRNRKLLATSQAEFKNIEPPIWLSDTTYDDYGKLDRVLHPWTPVETDGKKTFSIWGRRFVWSDESILPSQVLSQDVNLVEDPIRLIVTIGGKDYVVPLGSLKIASRKKSRITFAAEGEVAGVSVQADMWIEYDGFLWIELLINDSKTGRRIDNLRIVSTFKNSESTLYQTFSGPFGGWVDGKRIEIPWMTNVAGNIINFYHWLGNEDRGLGFTFTSLENCSPTSEDNFGTIIPGKDLTRYQINLVEKPTRMYKWSYRFGIQATPIKPLPQDYHSMMAGSVNYKPFSALQQIPENFDMLIVWPEPQTTIQMGLNNPYNVDAKQMRDVVKRWHDKGVGINTVATCPQKVCDYDEWFDDYIMEWKTIPESVLNWHGHLNYQDCGKSYTLRKWLFYGWAIENVKKFQTEGIYWDGWMAGSIACANPHHGCGWTDKDGKRHSTVPVLEGREFNQRMCMFLEDNVRSKYYSPATASERKGFPRYHFWLHSWEFVPSVMGFATEWLTGEFAAYPKKGISMLKPEGTYGKSMGLGIMRARCLSTNWGVPNYFHTVMWENKEDSLEKQTLGAYAWFLPHGTPISAVEYMNHRVVKQMTRIMMGFETRKSEFTPGWRANSHIEIESPIEREVMVATWEHPDKNKVLAVVSNLNISETREIKLRWKGFSNPKIKNAWTGEPLTTTNKIEVKLEPESFILMLIKKEK